jgi:hypothetical protein
MAQIEVESLGARRFRVRIRDGGVETSHLVSVPERSEFEGEDAERLVRASFEFLLEREPPSSILAEFELSDIARYFPKYWDELPRRLT